jgi:PKD domain
MLRFLLAATLAALFFVHPASAQEAQCPNMATTNGRQHIIVYVNGIMNTEDQARCSLGSLRQLTDADAQQSDFDLFYNPSQMGVQGFANDTAELRLQASNSDRATDIAQNDYTIKIRGASARYNFALGKLYSDRLEVETYENEVEREVYIRTDSLYSYLKEQVEKGKSITVVAHSQGNFYVEAAIAMMRYHDEDDVVSKIKVIGIAPVSSTTPSGVYFSLKGDRALDLQRKQTSLLKFYKVLPSNTGGCLGASVSAACGQVAKLSALDWMTHSFSQVYLSQFVIVDGISMSDRIRDQIVRSFDDFGFGWSVDLETIVDNTANPEIGIVSKKAWFNAKWPSNRRDGISLLLQTAFMSGLNINRYEWEFGDGNTKIETLSGSTTHVFKKSGVYRITLLAYDKSGDIYRCTKIVEVDPKKEFDFSQKEEEPCE